MDGEDAGDDAGEGLPIGGEVALVEVEWREAREEPPPRGEVRALSVEGRSEMMPPMMASGRPLMRSTSPAPRSPPAPGGGAGSWLWLVLFFFAASSGLDASMAVIAGGGDSSASS